MAAPRTYDQLIRHGLIHRYEGGPDQARRQLALARRDLAASRRLMAEDRDWAFAIAYNAVLQAGRALMLHEGYRATSGEGGHVAVIRFCEEYFGRRYREETELFDRMRVTRNRVVYDVSGSISHHEAQEAALFADSFVHRVAAVVEPENRRGDDTMSRAAQPGGDQPVS
jgi:uncharacterized protein (UPF0332 family)